MRNTRDVECAALGVTKASATHSIMLLDNGLLPNVGHGVEEGAKHAQQVAVHGVWHSGVAAVGSIERVGRYQDSQTHQAQEDTNEMSHRVLQSGKPAWGVRLDTTALDGSTWSPLCRGRDSLSP